MKNLPKHKKLILFDGFCNLCNTSVLYVIKRDKNNVFMFSPLQSNIGKQLIEKHGINLSLTDSILLYETGQGISYKSTAVLKIASKLTFPTNLLAVFLIMPSLFRDWVYDFIARNRYKWFGKKEECMIPTPEISSRFII
jgi:predicted DCC family thiol-disulfide oxidoreductase YuxK